MDRESKRESQLGDYKKLVLCFSPIVHHLPGVFLRNQEVLRVKSEFLDWLMRKLMGGRK